MYLNIDKDALKDHLESIELALGGNDSEPISGHFLFRVSATSCEVLAGGGKSNLAGYLKIDNLSPTNVADDETVCFTLSGKRLMGFLGAVDEGALGISYDADSKKVNISPVNGTNFNTVGLDTSNFPDFEGDYKKAVDAGAKAEITKDSLEAALDFTTPFIGENLSNPGFSLCRLKDDGTMNAGDGKSVAIYRHAKFTGEFKLRGSALKNVSAFLKKSEGLVKIHEGDNYYYLTNSENNYFGFNKVSFDFPTMKVPNLFEAVGDHIFEVDVAALKGTLNRLRWSLDNDLVKMGFKLGAVSSGDNAGDLSTKMMVTAKDTTGTISEEEVGIIRSHGDDEVSFFLNYQYVLKGIEKFESDKVTFYLNLKGHPFIKILETSEDNGSEVVRVLFLSLMKKDR